MDAKTQAEFTAFAGVVFDHVEAGIARFGSLEAFFAAAAAHGMFGFGQKVSA
jgi:hypothetical protein